jgi:hypothetical protein
MKTAKDLYQNPGDVYFFPSDYQPMLAEFGEILVQVDDDGYQGDSRVLYRDGLRFGYLCFGWGSCSGCDALQACDTVQEVQELMDELRDSIKWFDSAADAMQWIETHDWAGDYAYSEKFVTDALAVLRAGLT